MCACCLEDQTATEVEKPLAEPQLSLLIPYGKGGGSHQACTALALALRETQAMETALINHEGGEGAEALLHYLQLPPDGTMVLQHIDDLIAIGERRELDLTSQLRPLAILQTTFSQVYVNNLENRFGDWTSFLRFTRANPGSVRVALVGSPMANEGLYLSALEHLLSIDVVRVAFDRPMDRYMALVRGEVDALIEQPGDLRNFLENELIRPIFSFLPQPHPDYPDTASLADLPGEVPFLPRFRALFVHADTPEPIRLSLARAVDTAQRHPSFREFNRSRAMDLIQVSRAGDGPQRFFQQTLSTYRQLVAASNPEPTP